MASSEGVARPRVLLLSMPWTTLDEPSLGLALLKAVLLEHGIACRVRHLNLDLVPDMEVDAYRAVSQVFGLNDFLFTAPLQPAPVSDEQRRELAEMFGGSASMDACLARSALGLDYLDEIMRLRDEVVPAYLQRCLRLVAADDCTMVGFTCLFDQTVASLALAKLIKAACPEKLVVFGGYALEPPTGSAIMASFPCLDVLAFGEGEPKIVDLARASVDRSLLPAIPGILFRDESGMVRRGAAPAARVDLDRNPVPDFADWYDDLAACRVPDGDVGCDVLPVESSRGCWWGQVSHCTFCGIDDETMKYRAKSPSAVRRMLASLRDRHGCRRFRFTDYILPNGYFRTLLPELAGAEGLYDLHWEIKANIRPEQARLLRAAGVRSVQPGIESLSTSALEKMKKGVTAIQNVCTIRLCAEQGIRIIYNILYGFPDDRLDEYRGMVRLLPALYHLQPPAVCMPVMTVRHAPLQQTGAQSAPSGRLEAMRRYRVMFSDDHRAAIGFDLDDYCYTFERPYPLDPEVCALYDTLRYQVRYWVARHESGPPVLSYRPIGSGIAFLDTRPDLGGRELRFGQVHRRLHDAIGEGVSTLRDVVARAEVDASAAESVLAELQGERLIHQERGKLVRLALPASAAQTGRSSHGAGSEARPATAISDWASTP